MPEEGLSVDLDDALPAAEPTPEPAAAPAPVEPVAGAAPETGTPAPEVVAPVPEIDTSWLDGLGVPEPQAQPAPQPQAPQVPPQPQPYPQPYPPPQQPPQQPPPQAYGTDVDAYIDQRARQIAEQAVQANLGPVAMQLQHFQATTNNQMQALANTELTRAEHVARQADANELSKDKAYRENEQVRNMVRTNVKQWVSGAYEAAKMGDTRGLAQVHDPLFFQGVLALSKLKCGYQPNPITGPAQPAGAVVESTTAPKAEKTIELPPDLEALAQAYGPAYRKKLEDGLRDSEEAGDFEMEF